MHSCMQNDLMLYFPAVRCDPSYSRFCCNKEESDSNKPLYLHTVSRWWRQSARRNWSACTRFYIILSIAESALTEPIIVSCCCRNCCCLPCVRSLMSPRHAIVFHINISQGGVATRLKYGGNFSNHFTANLPLSVSILRNWSICTLLFCRKESGCAPRPSLQERPFFTQPIALPPSWPETQTLGRLRYQLVVTVSTELRGVISIVARRTSGRERVSHDYRSAWLATVLARSRRGRSVLISPIQLVYIAGVFSCNSGSSAKPSCDRT